MGDVAAVIQQGGAYGLERAMMADPGPDAAGDPLALAARWRAGGEAVALATVVETWGSAPCPAGSVMAIGAGGRIAGSVSGGCVEAAVIEAALETVRNGTPQLLSYGVSDGSAWSVGLACGGTIRVFVQPVAEQGGAMAPATLDRLAEAQAARGLAVLATRLADGAQLLLRDRDGQLLAEDGAIPEAVLAAAERAVAAGRSRLDEIAGDEWFLGVAMPAVRLLIVGAVHIAQALAPMARLLGMQAVVIDPRAGLATAERFPGTELVPAWPDDALRALGIDRHSAVVVLTHDPKLDDPALDAALASPAFYIGALGSRGTQGARRERLRALGHDTAALARIHGPVGLPIGAIGAGEIALSILAELVAVRRDAALAAPGAVPSTVLLAGRGG